MVCTLPLSCSSFQVYGIVGMQLALTAIVGSCFAFIPTLQGFALTSPWFGWVAILAPFVGEPHIALTPPGQACRLCQLLPLHPAMAMF